MRFIRYNREADLSALARRAYRFDRGVAPEALRRAEAALVRANPHLSDLRTVPRGSIVVIPKVEGLRTGERTLSGGEVAEGLLRQVAQATDSLGETLDGAAMTVIGQADETARIAESEAFRKAIGSMGQDAVNLAGKSVDGAARRAEQVKAVLAQQRAVIELVQRDLAELDKRFG